MSLARQVYRRLAEAFPHEFKVAYGTDMMQLGEDVIQHEHRIIALAAHQLIAREPERERERPGLTVTGIAPGRQAADPQLQVVTMRPDQADSPFQLGPAPRGQCIAQRQRELLRVRVRIVGAGLSRAAYRTVRATLG